MTVLFFRDSLHEHLFKVQLPQMRKTFYSQSQPITATSFDLGDKIAFLFCFRVGVRSRVQFGFSSSVWRQFTLKFVYGSFIHKLNVLYVVAMLPSD